LLINVLTTVKKNLESVLIVADDYEADILSNLSRNAMHESFKGKICCIKAPLYGPEKAEFLKDLAAVSNAQVIGGEIGIDPYKNEPGFDYYQYLGTLEGVVVSKEETMIRFKVDSLNEELVKERIKIAEFEKETAKASQIQDRAEERLARLSGRAATIKIGGKTETEIKDTRLRIEDAVNATRAAVETGVVPGGGLALYNIAQELPLFLETVKSVEEEAGAIIVFQALISPLRFIMENSNLNFELQQYLMEQERSASENINIGYNALTERFEDLVKAGVLDPSKVTISALESATSIAATLSETNGIIFEEPERNLNQYTIPAPEFLGSEGIF
jgi:chaperonin GroEL